MPFDASPFVLWPFGIALGSWFFFKIARRRELAFAPELNRAAPHGLAG